MEFTLKDTFESTPKEIYTAWLDSEKHGEMTGGAAQISNKEGDAFSAWDGYISGKNITLEPFQRIVQSWRTTEFEDDEPDSRIEILLKTVNGQTELTLIHSNLSENGGHYKQGWIDYYFQPMKSYFQGE